MVRDDERVSSIRWFFSPLGAKLLPFPTAFGSLVWENVELPFGAIGQQDRVITWDKGANPGYCGQVFVGEPDWYVSGIPPAELLGPDPITVCGKPGFTGKGGGSLDGEAHFMDSSLDALGGLEGNGTARFRDASLDAFGGAAGDGVSNFPAPDLNSTGGVEVGGIATFAAESFFTSTGGVECDGLGFVET